MTNPVPERVAPAAAKIKTYNAAVVNTLPVDVKIFTDGGWGPNPSEAGSGVEVYCDNKLAELKQCCVFAAAVNLISVVVCRGIEATNGGLLRKATLGILSATPICGLLL